MRDVVLIAGPPGAGKSTLAQDLAEQRGLRHIEWEHYQDDDAYQADAERLAHAPDAQLAVVRCCTTLDEQHAWASKIKATEVIVLDPGEDECVHRCHARGRASWQREVAGVRRWYAKRRTTTNVW